MKYTVTKVGCDYDVRAYIGLNGTIQISDKGYVALDNIPYPMQNSTASAFVAHFKGCNLKGEQFTIYLIDLDIACYYSIGSLP